ncbi:MAG: class I SAM-dependent methyltransferase [Hyphomicrobiaceae bacterium]|nr:class I SAM-dependent methyltransferase [Hyphomicrobiaceae bacterium]
MTENGEVRNARPRPERIKMTGPASWNDRYAGEGYSFGTKPNAFLESQAHLFQPGARVLSLADGEGRNGVWLAEKGCRVTSADYSPVGLLKAQSLAAARGVEIETVEADLTSWNWPHAVYDAIVAIYFHLPERHRATVHQSAAAALKPGGLIVIEGFRPEQIALQATEDSGGPTDVRMLFSAEILRTDFYGFKVLTCDETETFLQEGPYHTGRAAIIRFVAMKP